MSEVIEVFISAYTREFDYYDKLSALTGLKLESALKKSGIRAIVSYRAKGIESLRRKLEKRDVSGEGSKYKKVEDIYDDIADLAGVRVALYFPGDIDVVSKIISENFTELYSKTFPEGRREGSEGIYAKRFDGYHAKHYRVKLDDETRYSETPVEIQVASVLMHAWSEVEHDLVYKPMSGGASKEELMILDEINGMVIAGNIALERLQSAIIERVNGEGYVFQNHYDLASYISKEVGINEIINTQALYEFLDKIGLLEMSKFNEVLKVVKNILHGVFDNNEGDGYKGGYFLAAMLHAICQCYPEEIVSLICTGYMPFDSLRIKQDLITFTLGTHQEPCIQRAAFMSDKLCSYQNSLEKPSVYSIEKFEEICEPIDENVTLAEAKVLMSDFIEKIQKILDESFEQNDYANLIECARVVSKNIKLKETD